MALGRGRGTWVVVGGRSRYAMTEHDLARIEPLAQILRRRCRKCTAFCRLTHSILDSRRGNTVRVYHCAACGERMWDDGYRSFAEIFGE